MELELDNRKGKVLAGGSAQLRFNDVKLEAALTLPANTVLFRPTGPQVGIVGPDGKVEMRTVKIERDFGQTMDILAVVSPEDRVIANPSDSLTTGAIVSIPQTQIDKKEKNR